MAEIFDFPVARVPLNASIGGKKIRTDRDCIVRTDTSEIIGYVSAEDAVSINEVGAKVRVDRNYYKIAPHTEVVGRAREVINALGLKFKENTIMTNNGARLYQVFDFPDEKIEVPKSMVSVGDYVNMRLTATNSYDLSRKVGFEVGGIRKVCTNGLMLFKTAFFHMYKHSGAFQLDRAVEELQKAINTFRTDMLKQCTDMSNKKITTARGLEIIRDLKEKTILPQKYSDAVESVWCNPDNANSVVPVYDNDGTVVENEFATVMYNTEFDTARTIWTLYNAFTLVLTHMVGSHERRLLMYNQIHKALQRTI